MGQSVPRTEDPRLLRGGGRYVDDFRIPGAVHGYVLRSPHASARINSIDVRAAQQMPGVLGVFTGVDWAADDLGDFQGSYPRHQRDGSLAFRPVHASLAKDEVRVVGDPVAFVVAESLAEAKDASERIDVDYAPSDVAIDTKSVRSGPAVHGEHPDNETFFYELGDRDAVDAAFANADHVTVMDFVVNRITAATMEPRASIGDYDARDDRYTMYGATQRPFGVRQGLARDVFKVPENSMRIVAGDVGGSFGMKSGQYPEYNLCLWAAKKVGRPVRWVAERSEGMQSDFHDRDQVSHIELALDRKGNFLAFRVQNICNVGAFLDPGGMISPTGHLGGLAGLYTTPAIHVEVSAVLSNKAPIGPFRGSGRPEATYITERTIDQAARELGIDRAEIRRRNLIPADAIPFQTGLTYNYDSGDFPANFEQVLEMGEFADFEARREEAAARGQLRGISAINFVEQTAQTDGETVRIQFDPSGYVTVIAGSISHGQGHETMYKVVVSDRLGIDADDIRVQWGDTDRISWGGGTYASRTAILGGSAAANAADKLIEAGVGDIEFTDGTYVVAGTDKSIGLQEVAKVAFQPAKLPTGMEPGLYDENTFAPMEPTFPNGAHVCEVEIDPETGNTEIVRYSVVDDVGTVINMLTLEGQIHGGIGQAVGQCFTEHMIYDDESGQLLTGSFLDYGFPRADICVQYDCANNPSPTPKNPLGVKGAGEAGNVGGLAAIMNAVVDALSPLGIRHIDMPATPAKVWAAIQSANGAA